MIKKFAITTAVLLAGLLLVPFVKGFASTKANMP